MKMVKKIMLGITAAAVALALVSCNGITAGGDDSVKGDIIKGTTTKAYLGEKDGDGYTNQNEGTVREMQLFATKHYGAFAALTLENETATSKNGQLGYVFNYTENKDGTVNFVTIGFRNNAGKSDSYISQFYNIKKTEFSKTNFGVNTDVNANAVVLPASAAKALTAEAVTAIKGSGVPTELQITVGDDGIFNLGSWANISDGTATIGVKVTAEDDGSYTVEYFDKDSIDDNFKLKNDAVAKGTEIVSAAIAGNGKKTQTRLGCYAAIYAGKTLKGFWRFSSIVGEDIPVEGFED